VLPEIAAFEASEVVVPYGPLSSTDQAVPGNLAKTDGGAEDMADAVHPGCLTTLEMGIDNSDPVVDFLKSETVFWGREDGLADEGGVGEVGLVCGVGAWGQGVGKLVVVIL